MAVDREVEEFSTVNRSSLLFNDGYHSVDFVLVWDQHKALCTTPTAVSKRDVFENNLIDEGLVLEYENPLPNGLVFIKIHAPLKVLCRYGEILKLRMPMREELCHVEKVEKLNPVLHATMYLSQKIPAFQKVHTKTNKLVSGVTSCKDHLLKSLYVNPIIFPPKSLRFTAVYSRDKEYLFDVTAEDFFTPAIRSRICKFILDRQKFSNNSDDDFAFGIERLIEESVYTAAYPLHDGDLRNPGSMRFTLYNHWAAVKKCLHYQPLDHIKDYFGIKISLYFAWLGFYTHMLIPASIIGVICFIYSISTLFQNQPRYTNLNRHAI